MNSMHLIGAEDVQRAGQTIARAAETMFNVAITMDNTADRMRQFLDEFASRIEVACKDTNPDIGGPRKLIVNDKREREEWEKWVIRENLAYHDPQYGLCFYDRGAAGPSWQAWRARADER